MRNGEWLAGATAGFVRDGATKSLPCGNRPDRARAGLLAIAALGLVTFGGASMLGRTAVVPVSAPADASGVTSADLADPSALIPGQRRTSAKHPAALAGAGAAAAFPGMRSARR